MKRTNDYSSNLTNLVAAEQSLKVIAKLVTPSVAPQSAKKIRSALKSIAGAINHANRMISEREGVQ